MNWKRIVGWSFLILLAMNVVGFCAGLTMEHWEIYGATIETAITNARHVRRVAYAIVAALLYWRFALGVPAHRFLHVVAVFVGIQLIDIAIEIVFFKGTIAFDPWGLARGFGAALVGYVLAMWSSRRSRRPPALDGTAQD